MARNKNKVILVCDECLSRNYSTTKSSLSLERLTLNKFCRRCGKHTPHRESK